MKRILSVLMVLAMVVSCSFMATAQDVSFLSDEAGLTDGSFLENVGAPKAEYKIANITRTLMNAHWVKNKEGFEAAGKHYGVVADVFAVQSEQDVMDQLNILETCIEKGYNAVIVSPITEQNLLPGLKKATDAGIVIINVDTAEISQQSADENGIKITTFLGSDNYDSGKMAAAFMSEKLGDKQAEVAVLEGNPGDTCAIDRTGGFAAAAKELSNLTVVASQTGKWDRLESLNVATGILRANPNVRGIYCNNDTMVLGVMQAAADLGYKVLTSDNLDQAGEDKTLILIGNDGIPEALQAVEEGTLTGTIAQKPYLMGYSAVEAAIIALNGEEAPARFSTPVALVTKADF